ncbi:hypothetical protein [Priestia aryabhattai]|nr:hypothetical protein [Priestia aryabhattai]WKG30186.1 hypothetical protein QYS54_23950 [Priestia aryabhattai]
MDKTLVKLAKSFSTDLMTQIYFMKLIKETVAELGGKNNATISN